MRFAVKRGARTRGFIMVSVMWMGLGLMLAVAGFVAQSRLGALTLRAEVETLRAQELARSGVNLALAALTRQATAEGRSTAPPATLSFALAEGQIAVTIQDEAGKIDINEAPVELLRPLLQGMVQSVDAFDASNMAQAIVATRTERGPYSGLPALSAQFELAPATAAALQEVLTVHNYTPRVDPRSAPRAVLAAIPGLGGAAADDILARRAAGRGMPQLGTAAVWLAPRSGPVYRITARARMTGGITATRSALVRANGLAFNSSRLRFEVLAWQGGT